LALEIYTKNFLVEFTFVPYRYNMTAIRMKILMELISSLVVYRNWHTKQTIDNTELSVALIIMIK